MQETVLIDVSEFVRNPLRTGIQRVVRELISRWPDDCPMTLAAYDPDLDDLYAVPLEAVEFAMNVIHNTRSEADARAELSALNEPHLRKPLRGARKHRVLIPELFAGSQRIGFYHSMLAQGARAHFIVFDLIPWLEPEAVGLTRTGGLMLYLDLLIRAKRRAFISDAVREAFARRVLRADLDPGPAIGLGADGLRLERQTFDPGRREFVCIGAFDGRKSQELVFEGFRLAQVNGAVLSFVGRVPPDPAPALRPLLSFRGDDVRVIANPTDAQVGEQVRASRASIFVSTHEGFGLPAVETLFCGLPTVVHKDLPALKGNSPKGQIRLDEVTPKTIASAFEALMDDHQAERLWLDAADLELPTWNSYAQRVADWVSS